MSIGQFAKSRETLWPVFSPEFVRGLAEAIISKPDIRTGNYLDSLFELIEGDGARLSSLPSKAISLTAEKYAASTWSLEKFLKLAEAAENRGEGGSAAFATPAVVTKFIAAYSHKPQALSRALRQLEQSAPNIHAAFCREIETQQKAKADLARRQTLEQQAAQAEITPKNEAEDKGDKRGGHGVRGGRVLGLP